MRRRKKLPLPMVIVLAQLCGAWTIHRSFTPHEVRYSNIASDIVPVDSRVAEAMGESRANPVQSYYKIVGTVTKVSDGDTIWVTAHGNRVKVRMDRIDAPESNQAYGKAARQFLADRIMGKDVEVRYTKTDRYGRVLGIVYLNGEDINLMMVREGMAWHYSHFDHTPAYVQAHEEARAAKRGLWADANPSTPTTGTSGNSAGNMMKQAPVSDRIDSACWEKKGQP